MELLLFFIIAFVAGLITMLAPCTLPMLPAFLANSGLSQKGKLTSNTFFFAVGVSAMFTLLGLAAGAFGVFLTEQRKILIIISAIAIIIFGILSLFGSSHQKTLKPKSQTKKGSFVFGLVFALGWSSCIGPVLGIILFLAATLSSVLLGAALLFTYSIGLLFPLLVLAKILDSLPRNGKFWTLLKGKLFEVKIRGKTFYFHSTNVFASIVFILLGIFILVNLYFHIPLFATNSVMSNWVFDMQDVLVQKINLSRLL
jgi:cytochrome c-type biogenesis protein